jgi:hypothetical protein
MERMRKSMIEGLARLEAELIALEDARLGFGPQGSVEIGVGVG